MADNLNIQDNYGLDDNEPGIPSNLDMSKITEIENNTQPEYIDNNEHNVRNAVSKTQMTD